MNDNTMLANQMCDKPFKFHLYQTVLQVVSSDDLHVGRMLECQQHEVKPHTTNGAEQVTWYHVRFG